jgi:hypothetical protein
MSQNVFKLAKVAVTLTAVTAVTVIANPTRAQANGLWDYAIGGTNNGSGGSVFDYKGIAIKEDGNDVFIALNSNMTLRGQECGRNARGQLTCTPSQIRSGREVINYGDLFLNFTGKSFKEASDAGELMAVHFASHGSQSGANQGIGLYSNVKAKNTTLQNYGWNNTTDWSNWSKSTNSARKLNDSYGDLNARDTYFGGQQSGSGKILNAIGTGQKVASIMMMDSAQLASAGLNFGAARGANGERADGSVTLGFRFQKTADFKAGNFIASLFAECGNDGLAIKSMMAKGKVPEPASMAGIAAVGGLMLRRLRRRR